MFILFALNITQVAAVDIPIERLSISNDYASVQIAGSDICNLVNTLTESSSLQPDNINWDNVYKYMLIIMISLHYPLIQKTIL